MFGVAAGKSEVSVIPAPSHVLSVSLSAVFQSFLFDVLKLHCNVSRCQRGFPSALWYTLGPFTLRSFIFS